MYLFSEGVFAIQIDIRAHRQSQLGWGAMHWVSIAQFPGSQWTRAIPTNAEIRPKVGDIATLVHNKRLEEDCIYNGRLACRNWV